MPNPPPKTDRAHAAFLAFGGDKKRLDAFYKTYPTHVVEVVEQPDGPKRKSTRTAGARDKLRAANLAIALHNGWIVASTPSTKLTIAAMKDDEIKALVLLVAPPPARPIGATTSSIVLEKDVHNSKVITAHLLGAWRDEADAAHKALGGKGIQTLLSPEAKKTQTLLKDSRMMIEGIIKALESATDLNLGKTKTATYSTGNDIYFLVTENSLLQALAVASRSKEDNWLHVDAVATAPWNVFDLSPEKKRAARGGGMIVMDAVKKFAEDEKMAGVKLDSFASALGFYVKCGFKRVQTESKEERPAMTWTASKPKTKEQILVVSQ